MPKKDTKLVNAFLDDFVEQLTSEFPKEIDFILLFGSAARGEFRLGISDVDMIIQVKNANEMQKIEKYAEDIFWKLDKKHGTMLNQVCSTKREDVFGILEKKVKLYKPFEILGPEDIKWSEGKISGEGLGIFAIVAPISQFAKKVKAEGNVLYGRNILKEIRIKESFLDKVKEIIIPYALSISALVLSPFAPNKALGYSLKSVLYAISAQMGLLEASTTKKTHLKVKILRAQLGDYYSVRLAREAIHARMNFEKVKKEWSYIDKVAFCFQAPIYIVYNNLMSIFGLIKN